MEERNSELELAWEYVAETSQNVFLTGRAGTGKTTFLKRVVEECPKRKIVLAPTGVAAINAGGVTLHSFFQLPFGLFLPEFQHLRTGENASRFKFQKKKKKIIRSLELMIIDEVSMIRADLMDEIDSLLRRIRHNSLPFGGVQLLMIGDIQQLSPVVKEDEWEIMKRYYPSPYFFDSKVLADSQFRLIELKQIYRQKDSEFIKILGAVRDNRMTDDLLARLNSRYIPDYVAPEGCITLCTHNSTAKSINDSRLKEIDAPEYKFSAFVSGNFPENMYPQDTELVLKKGAQVMFTKNDPSPDKEYVNGTLGVVSYIDDENIAVKLDGGEEIAVEPLSWENIKYDINEETKEIVSDIDGLFTQYPLKTAWAITIHKSQGLTFENAVIDARNSFSHGQVYVALSRCRSLEGLVLKEKLNRHSIIKDYRVEDFNNLVTKSLPTAKDLENDKKSYFLEVLKSLFNLDQLKIIYLTFLKFAKSTISEVYPKALSLWESTADTFISEMYQVGIRFNRTLDKLAGDDYRTSSHLQERVVKASDYFSSKAVELLIPLVKASSSFDFDDKLKKKLYKQYFTNFYETLFLHVLLWNYTSGGFDLDKFIHKRAVLSAEVTDASVSSLFALAGMTDKKESDSGHNIQNNDFFEELRCWRNEKAKEAELPAYCIIHQKPLIAISEMLPSSEAELLSIKGVGKKFIEKYGEEILNICRAEEKKLDSTSIK